MLRYRIIYILILATATSYHVIYPYWFAWYLLVVLLLLLPLDFIVSLPGMLTRRVSLSAPHTLEQGEHGELIVTTLSDRPFPSGVILARLYVKNDEERVSHRLRCASELNSHSQLNIDTLHSGLTTFKVERLRPTSLLELISIPVKKDVMVSTLVLPAPAIPPNTTPLPSSVTLRPKPGGDFSEDYDLRGYRAGDPINSVHWKLSAKLDATIVREPMAPPPHGRLVWADMWTSAHERDLILGRLRWISSYLLEHDCLHYLRLGDAGAIWEITKSEDFTDYLHQTLGGAAKPTRASVPARFTWVFHVDAKEESL